MRIKQSICYPLFKPDDMSLEELFALASKIGYKAADCGSGGMTSRTWRRWRKGTG